MKIRVQKYPNNGGKYMNLRNGDQNDRAGVKREVKRSNKHQKEDQNDGAGVKRERKRSEKLRHEKISKFSILME